MWVMPGMITCGLKQHSIAGGMSHTCVCPSLTLSFLLTGTMRSTRGHAVNMSRRESYTGSGAEITAGSQPSSYGPPAGAYMPGFSLGHRPGGLAAGGVGGVGGGAGSSGEDEVRCGMRRWGGESGE